MTKIEREVEAYRRFRSLCTELVAVNEQICAAKAIGESIQPFGVDPRIVREQSHQIPIERQPAAQTKPIRTVAPQRRNQRSGDAAGQDIPFSG